MSLTKACCTLPPVQSDYSPKGKKHVVGDLEYYQVGENSSNTLFAIYDVLGNHSNTYQFCDLISKAGFQVIMPDFFRGKPWSLEKFPPKDYTELIQWANVEHSFQNRVHKDILAVLEDLKKSQSIQNLGIFGFCWGGKQVVEAIKLSEPLFKAGAFLHPAFLTKEDFEAINQPALGIITKDESSILDQFDFMRPEIFKLSEKHDFTDTFHGFAAARGDFKDETNRKRVDDAINITATFFQKYLTYFILD